MPSVANKTKKNSDKIVTISEHTPYTNLGRGSKLRHNNMLNKTRQQIQNILGKFVCKTLLALINHIVAGGG